MILVPLVVLNIKICLTIAFCISNWFTHARGPSVTLVGDDNFRPFIGVAREVAIVKVLVS